MEQKIEVTSLATEATTGRAILVNMPGDSTRPVKMRINKYQRLAKYCVFCFLRPKAKNFDYASILPPQSEIAGKIRAIYQKHQAEREPFAFCIHELLNAQVLRDLGSRCAKRFAF